MKQFARVAISLSFTTWAVLAAAQQQAPAGSPDDGKVVPSRQDLKPYQPSAAVLDDNTQRAHDRDQGVNDATQSTSAKRTQGEELAFDWKQIDMNHDNLISPDEMREALNSGKSASSGKADVKKP